MSESIMLSMAALFVVSSICQWVAWRVNLPAIIFLLLVGIFAGPVLGLVQPDLLLGDLLFPFVSLSVAIILFEGSLTLKFKEISGLQAVVRNMISYGMLVTWLISTVATRFATGISWEISSLFGAIMVVTGPTVIAPMLRSVRPTASIANILRWEGIVIDPIGASLAVLIYEFIISGGGEKAFSHTLLTFGRIVGIGTTVGCFSGYFFGQALRNHWLPEFLHNISTLALVFGAYALSNFFQPESGLVTVTVLGMWLANMKGVNMRDILDFKESLSIILISLLFIILAARLDFETLRQLGWKAVFVLLAIQFLARPLNVMVSAIGSKLTWPERHLLAWIAPRGIVAAAISALFALHLEEAGFADAHLLVPLTFMVIIGTVMLQSTTARFIAQWLGVAEPEPKGFLIIGANEVARTIAKALKESGLHVLLADTGWEQISRARMEGLHTYMGNPISEHADRHLDLVGIGRMLALSPQESVNVAAVMHYRLEFGQNNLFILQSQADETLSGKLKVSEQSRGQTLFAGNVTYTSLSQMLRGSGEIRTTKLTENFNFDQLVKEHCEKMVPLFALDMKGNLHVFTPDRPVKPLAGWSVISIVCSRREVKLQNGNHSGQKTR